MARQVLGERPRAPEQIATHRAADGAAGILRHDEAPQGTLALGMGCGGVEPDGCGEREELAVDGERPAGRQGDALRPQRPWCAGKVGQLAEKT